MSNELTKKEAGFVRDYVETGHGTQSVLDNYDTDDENVAASIASQNLRKVKIQDAIKSIAEQIPDSLLVEKHLELLNVPKKVRRYVKGELEFEDEEVDSQAIGKGLDMAYKLKGSYAAEKKDITTNGERINITPEQLALAKKYEEALKENL